MVQEDKHSVTFVRVKKESIVKVLAYFCLEELRRNREQEGKLFGALFRQKSIDEMQRKGIPLGYFFALDWHFCRYSCDLEADYKFFVENGFMNNEPARRQALIFLNKHLPRHIIKKAREMAWKLRNLEGDQAIRISDRTDLEAIAQSKLVFSDTEIADYFDVSSETMESDLKKLLIESCKEDKPLPTAKPESIRLGKVKGLVKSSGFFMLVEDCINWGSSEDCMLISLFSGSVRNPSNYCVAVIRDSLTFEQLRRLDRTFPRYIVIGIAESIPEQLRAQGIASNGVLVVLAVLENVLDSTAVILSVEECAKEIEELARADRDKTYELLRELVPSINNTITIEDVKRVLRFIRDQINDELLEQFEPVKYPHQTLSDGIGTCKDKVCLACSLLGQMERKLEKIGIAFFDTSGNKIANHVEIAFRFHGGPSGVFELTNSGYSRKKHILTIAFQPFGKPEFIRVGTHTPFDFTDAITKFTMSKKDLHSKIEIPQPLNFHLKGFVQFNMFEMERD